MEKKYSVCVGAQDENYDGESFERFSTNNKKEALKEFNRIAKSNAAKQGWDSKYAYAVVELIDNNDYSSLKIKRIALKK